MSEPEPAAEADQPGAVAPRQFWPESRARRLGAVLVFAALGTPFVLMATQRLPLGDAFVVFLQGGLVALFGWMAVEFLLSQRLVALRKWGLVLFGALVVAQVLYVTDRRLAFRGALLGLHQAVQDALQLQDGNTRVTARLLTGRDPSGYGGLTGLSEAIAEETRRAALEDADFAERYAALDAGHLITPATLVSAPAIAQARERQRLLRELLTRQARVVQAEQERAGQMYRRADVSIREHDELVSGFEQRRQTALELQIGFDKASREAIARREALLAFGQENGGKLGLQGAELRLPTAALRQTHTRLAGELEQARTGEQGAFKSLRDYRESTLRSLADNLEKALPGKS